MALTPLQIEGTWEQILTLAPCLAGRRLRLIVLEKVGVTDAPEEAALPMSEQFAKIRAENPEDWDDATPDAL